MFEDKTAEAIFQKLKEDELLLATVKQCFKLMRNFEELSPKSRELVINKCVEMGADEMASAFRQIADKPMVVQKNKKPCQCANTDRAALIPTTEIKG